MLTQQIINTAGLAFGMFGVVLIFFWGPPQPAFDQAVLVSVETGTILKDGTRVSDIVESEKKQKTRYQFLSRTGLLLIFIGFVIQIAGVWVA